MSMYTSAVYYTSIKTGFLSQHQYYQYVLKCLHASMDESRWIQITCFMFLTLFSITLERISLFAIAVIYSKSIILNYQNREHNIIKY